MTSSARMIHLQADLIQTKMWQQQCWWVLWFLSPGPLLKILISWSSCSLVLICLFSFGDPLLMVLFSWWSSSPPLFLVVICWSCLLVLAGPRLLVLLFWSTPHCILLITLLVPIDDNLLNSLCAKATSSICRWKLHIIGGSINLMTKTRWRRLMEDDFSHCWCHLGPGVSEGSDL